MAAEIGRLAIQQVEQQVDAIGLRRGAQDGGYCLVSDQTSIYRGIERGDGQGNIDRSNLV